jgi:protein O-GlcNAc transferase
MLSSDAMEPENGQEHYTEKLVRLPGLSVAMSRPTVRPSNRTRADLGWADDDVVFLVPQSLFKLLPTEDQLYTRIAKQVPNARFAFIHNSSTTVTGLFQRRMYAAFQRAGLDPERHVCLLPGMNWDDYLKTNALADVFLDGMTWSGGVTTMEAIAMGLVPVTCPGHNMRARHTAAILTELGVTESIAKDHDEYVQLAVQLGNDPVLRADLRTRLLANVDHLYDDDRVIPALEAFLHAAVEGTYQTNPTVSSGAM